MKRRLKNEGTIMQVGTYADGRAKYRGRVRVTLPDGTRKRVDTRYFDSATAASDAIPALIEEYSVAVISHNETVESYLMNWFDEDPDLAPKSIENRLMNIKQRIVPSIGQYSLKEIGAPHIRKVYDANKHLSKNSKVQIRRTLNKAFEDAIESRLITRNPMHDYRNHPKVHKAKITTLTDKDQDSLLAVKDRWNPLWELLLGTGCRISEALALKWSSVNIDEGYIEITQQLQRVQGKLVLRELKTESSEREIEIDDQLIDVLRDMKTELQQQKIIPLDGLLFPNRFGGGLEHKVVARAFAHSLEKAGIQRHYTLHNLRATHATMCAEADLPTKVTQERLGHADPAITTKYYTHVTDRMKRQSVKKLNNYRQDRAKVAKKVANSDISADK